MADPKPRGGPPTDRVPLYPDRHRPGRDDSARAKFEADRDHQMGVLLAEVASGRQAREDLERAFEEEREARASIYEELAREREARQRAETDIRRKLTQPPPRRWDWVTQSPAIIALITAITGGVIAIVKVSKPEPPPDKITPAVAKVLRPLIEDAHRKRADDIELRQFLRGVFELNNMSFPSVPGSPPAADLRVLPAPLKTPSKRGAKPAEDRAPDIQFATPFPGVRQEMPDVTIPSVPAPEAEPGDEAEKVDP